MFCHKPFSRINSVQKLASAVISPTKRKIGGAIFVWLFLLLDAGQLFHNLFTKRCSIS
ncbi:hydrolase [Enterococcus faecium]|nr:hydrolase [Enterococcus faecium]EGP5631586.1 hydrolase [Enterococcus faecium]PQC81275.1 hydrolase [Enterococcus faecium]